MATQAELRNLRSRISSARQQTQSQQEELEEQSRQVNIAQQQASQLQSQLESQKAIRNGGGIEGLRRRQEQSKQLARRQSQLAQAEKQLESFSSSLGQRSTRLTEFGERIKREQELKAARSRASDILSGTDPGVFISQDVSKALRLAGQAKRAGIEETIKGAEEELRRTLSPAERTELTSKLLTARPGESVTFGGGLQSFLPQTPSQQFIDIASRSPGVPPTRTQQFLRGTVFNPQLVGIGIPGKTILTAREIKERAQRSELLAVRGISQLIPETPAGVAVIGGLGAVSLVPGAAPAIGASFGALGLRQAIIAPTPEARVAGGIVAGLGALGAVSVVRAPPKVDVRFVSRPTEVGTTRSLFFAEQRGLVSRRQFVGAVEGRILPRGQDIFTGGARGVLREIRRDIITGKPVFREPTPFAVTEFGKLTPSQVSLLLKEGRITVRTPGEQTFTTISVGATKTPGGQTQFFVSRGGGGQFGGRNLFISRSRDIIRTKEGKVKLGKGKGQELGIIEETPVFDQFAVTGDQALSSAQVAAIARQRGITTTAVRQVLTERATQQAAQRATQVSALTSSATGGVFGTSIFAQPRQVQETQQRQVPSQLQPQVQRQSQTRLLSQQERSDVAQRAKSIVRLETQQRQRDISLTGFAQPQQANQRQRLTQIQNQLVVQMVEQKQKLKLVTKTIPDIPKPRVDIKVPPIPKLELANKRKLLKKLQNIKGSLDVIVGIPGESKVKVIARRLAAFRALKKGRDFTDKNLAASFKLRENSAKPRQKDIPPFKLGKKFRPGKRDLLRIVEKRKFRLDSASERAQLKRLNRRRKKKKK